MSLLPERTCICLSFVGFGLAWLFGLAFSISFETIVIRAAIIAAILGALGYALAKVIMISVGEDLSALSQPSKGSLKRDSKRQEQSNPDRPLDPEGAAQEVSPMRMPEEEILSGLSSANVRE